MDLDQLRRQAKELRDAARRGEPEASKRVRAVAAGLGEPATLSLAQLVIAREHGHPSWPALVFAARRDGIDLGRFLELSLQGPSTTAVTMLRDHPRLLEDPFAAAVVGEADRAVTAVSAVDARGWSPLLYACYSRWHLFDPDRAERLTQTVDRLLDAGANPNSHNGRLPGQGYQSALHGAVVTDKPQVVAALLARGALVDDRSSLPVAAELRHHRCLELLLDHGATVERTWALGAAVFAKDAWALRRLLEAVRDRGGDAAGLATEQLEDAAREGVSALVAALLDFGADPTGRPGLVREAVRAGSSEAAALLTRHGAAGEINAVDQLIGACMRGDRAEARRLAVDARDLTRTLSGEDASVLVHTAGRTAPMAVELLLDAGWPIGARDDLGETALHNAAYHGDVETVRLLLDRGATVDARDDRFNSTPLAFATVGSRERQHDADARGDWITTVRTLLDGGASREGVWLSGDKAPSDQVAAVLREYGVQPTAEQEPAHSADEATEPAALDGGVLTEVAELLRVAFATTDMDLFGSMLAPDVRWGGGPLGCTGRDQVLAQYRQSADLGFRGTVTAAETHGYETLVIELQYAGAADGLPAGPVGTRAQVLRIIDDLIVSIDGYPDLASARHALDSPTTG